VREETSSRREGQVKGGLASLDPRIRHHLSDQGLLHEYLFVTSVSPCFARRFTTNPSWVEEIFSPFGLGARGFDDHKAHIDALLEKGGGLEDIRLYKQREHLRIGIRDLLGLDHVPVLLEELSHLAAAVIQGTLRVVEGEMEGRYGMPTTPQGNRAAFAVMGLGKLGGMELNFDSDVDLIYLYETEKGETSGSKVVGNHEYFVRLCETLTNALSAITPQGQVYKVDLRLRPEGNRGDIVLPLRSYEIYYESWGQAWERAALIKAHPVAGNPSLGKAFLETVRPFVYRRYLDFKALDEIRELKVKIDAQARSKGGYDVKLGGGGIREIEFVTQAIQLIYGGKEPWLGERNTLRALHRIMGKGLLSKEDYQTLSGAYIFLRKLENRLQMVDCLQTHSLPMDSKGKARLSEMMGYQRDSIRNLEGDLKTHREGVHAIFQRFFSPAREEEELVYMEEDELEEVLAAHGFRDLPRALRNLRTLTEGKAFEHPSPEAKTLFIRLLPRLLEEASKAVRPDWALDHLEAMASVQKEGRRTFYSFLLENQGVMGLLVKIFGSSDYLSHHLVSHPELVDYLADPQFLYGLKALEELEEELEEDLRVKGVVSFSAWLDELRRWKHREIFRIGMGDLFSHFPLQKITHLWTKVADVVVRRLWAWLTGGDDVPFCVLALGKWGGRELTYHSDLDMVFIIKGDGARENELAVELVRALSSVSREGALFKVDLRLRPHGAHGAMVYPLRDFGKYLATSARLWERQAMIKARSVAGDPVLQREVLEMIQSWVYRDPLPPDSGERIWNMRLKMEEELAQGPHHIKYSAGGLVDLEFLVQYWQLLKGREFPQVRRTSTLGALAGLLRAGLIEEDLHGRVREGYLFLRRVENRLRVMYDVPSSCIPKEEEERDRLARSLGFSTGRKFMEVYGEVTRGNRELLKEVFIGG
jgi:glutamate-ammonia-ligase adenylyltransferase